MKLLCIALFACGLAMAQAKVTLTGPAVRLGAQATVTATLSGSTGVASAQWSVPAQPGIVATPGPATTAAGKALNCQYSVAPPGLYGCVVSGGSSVLSDGVLATMTVPAPSTATALPMANLLGVNAAGDSPGIPIVSGPLFTLAVLSPCDLNGDGKIDLLDTRNLTDQIEGVVPATTDLNGDGKTNVIDLQRIVNAAVDGVCRVGF